MPEGINYRVLVLPRTMQMTPEVLRKLHKLVAAGATIVGQRPRTSPSLVHYPDADAEVRALATDLWGDTDGVTDTQHAFGKGMTYTGLALDEVLNRLQDPPGATTLVADRSGNRQPGIEPAAYVEKLGFTTVPLDLAEREAVFVALRNAAPEGGHTAAHAVETTLATIPGPWTLTFPPNLGAPPSMQMRNLVSWTEVSDPGVKYFSGTATYSKDVQAPAAWFRPGQHLYLDLGTVCDIAEVKVNGKSVGMVWAPPYWLDVTSALKPGMNRLAIRVTNEWTNRLVGDRLLPPGKRVLSQAGPTPPRGGFFFGPTEPAESGLLGSVRFVAERGQ